MDKENLREELDRIEDPEIKAITEEVLDSAPLHFWSLAASSTGKYHSEDENGPGGLVVHTKRVCQCAEVILDAWAHKEISFDIIRSACILHDTCKYGTGITAPRYTLNDHPRIGGDFIEKVAQKRNLNLEKAEVIAAAVRSHSGRWGSPRPSTLNEEVVHLADVFATRIHDKRVVL